MMTGKTPCGKVHRIIRYEDGWWLLEMELGDPQWFRAEDVEISQEHLN